MIELLDISYELNKKLLLKGINLSIAIGELIVVLGTNGAGKSTLLKLLAGELKPGSGTININRKSINNYKPEEIARLRAVLAQQNILSAPFSVKDVVMMGRYPHIKTSETQADHSIVNSALHLFDINHIKDRNYLFLSGGEQQRVHLARVFAQIWNTDQASDRYLFMDEPLNNLDIKHQHKTMKLIKDFTNLNNTSVLVLHDLNLAAMYADKIILLKEGSIYAYGPPSEVINEINLNEAFEINTSVKTHPLQDTPHIYFFNGNSSIEKSAKINYSISTY